jgi:asparagine synthase (glutamine-hydrolysing)
MCGYIGQISFKEINSELIEKCNENIVCRGPDEKIVYTNKNTKNFQPNKMFNFSFIFNRLKIVDLAPQASQPMISEKFNTILMFNGEIYNHVELRRNLEKANIEFKSSHSDTEVVLNGISKYGIDFVKNFVGQFSIAFIDLNLNKIFLIRDRLGQKPLFYSIDDENLYFGSNLKSIKKLSNNDTVDLDQINNYLNLGVVPSPKTIYQNIYKVKPAQVLEFAFKDNKIFQTNNIYWNPSDYLSDKHFKNDEIMNLIKDSVNMRMKADVGIANFLSGGIDSTSLIKMVSKDYDINSFSMSVNESTYDESRWINSVSETYNTSNTTVNLDSKKLTKESIIESIKIFDEPYSDPSTIPSYLLAKTISKKFKVAISGDGGDELFGGYERLQITMQKKKFGNSIFSKFYKFYPSFLGTGNRILRNSNDLKISFSSFLEDKKFLKLLGIESKFNFIENYLDNCDDELKNLIIADIHFYLSEMMMLKVDRTSMANSLEVRSPFVDHRLIQYILEHKFTVENLKNPKQLLKDFLSVDFKDEFLNRKKMGFVFDLESWIYKNQKFVKSIINNSKHLKEVNLNKIPLLFLYKSRINAIRIWKLFFLAIYLDN